MERTSRGVAGRGREKNWLDTPVEVFGQLFRGADAQLLALGGIAPLQDHAVFRDAKKLGQVGDEMFIRPAFDGWGSEPDFETIADHPSQGIVAGAWLDPYLKNEVRSVPAEPAHVVDRSRGTGLSCLKSFTSGTGR
jgi:hypothetical protein